MKPTNLDDIRKSFSIQAENFENINMNFSKQQYLDGIVRCMELKSEDNVLEAAAGTCVCGRAVAPFVKSVTCLDATPAMLAVGRDAATQNNLHNMRFLEGFVEEIPFPDETFDAVLTRLSFHHFTEIEKPFSEMDRVLKHGGTLTVIDMEASEESLRKTQDRLETLRDPSHVKTCSKGELAALYEKHGYTLTKQDSVVFPVSLDAWFELTKAPDIVKFGVTVSLQAELQGGAATGFRPYIKDGALYFEQRWLTLIGIKR